MSDKIDLYGMMYALRERVVDEARNDYSAREALANIDRMHQKMIAYICGWEDCAGWYVKYAYGRKLISASMECGYMVAIMVAMSYLDGHSWPREPHLRHTWAAFRAGVDLRDYVYEGGPQ